MSKDIQVNKSHYFEEYDDVSRFISYFYQIDTIRKLNPSNILEVGIGNKTVSNYLKANGHSVVTCDFDAKLKPDCIADIHSLPFKNESFDIIAAFEVLEHLPFSRMNEIIRELCRVSDRYVVLSIPYSAITFEVAIKFPFSGKLLNKEVLNPHLSIPHFHSDIKAGEHRWEIGRRSYPSKRITELLRKQFKIKRQFSPLLNKYHRFFVLEKIPE